MVAFGLSSINLDVVGGQKPSDNWIKVLVVCGVEYLPDVPWTAHVHIVHFIVGTTGTKFHLEVEMIGYCYIALLRSTSQQMQVGGWPQVGCC